MALRVVIKDSTIHTRTVSRPGKEAFTVRYQLGVLVAGPNTMEMEVSLIREQSGYAAGQYEVDDRSFGVDDYRRFRVVRLELRPVAVSAAAAPAAAARG